MAVKRMVESDTKQEARIWTIHTHKLSNSNNNKQPTQNHQPLPEPSQNPLITQQS